MCGRGEGGLWALPVEVAALAEAKDTTSIADEKLCLLAISRGAGDELWEAYVNLSRAVKVDSTKPHRGKCNLLIVLTSGLDRTQGVQGAECLPMDSLN